MVMVAFGPTWLALLAENQLDTCTNNSIMKDVVYIIITIFTQMQTELKVC